VAPIMGSNKERFLTGSILSSINLH
jgi:hypothetical protein